MAPATRSALTRKNDSSPVASVPEGIVQSHERCQALGISRIGAPDYTLINRADLNITLDRNRRMHAHAAPVMNMLYEQIVNTESMVVLTDDTGVIVHAIGDDDFLDRASKVALKPGANWSEPAKGTNAIGTALVSEAPTLVHADQHFQYANQFLTCSAAPIMDPRGNLLGVLDVSGDFRSYHQHTMALVKMSARMIENRWITDEFSHGLRLHLHQQGDMIGTLMEGILSISPDGHILGANRGALEQLDLSGAALRKHTLDTLFGISVDTLMDLFRNPGQPRVALHLPDGRCIMAIARMEMSPRTMPVTQLREAGSTGTPLPSTPPALAAAPPSAVPLEPPVRPPRQSLALNRLLTGDPQVAILVDKVRRLLNRDIPLMILGETGVGKELLARAVHADSDRADKPFVAVNCASIPENLIEAELFGVEEGAYTSARKRSPAGRIAQAHGGTLFLDEIGDMPLSLQARLLRVLQERQVTPLGSQRSIPVDVHVICATHRNLRDLIDQKTFREDLYYRLNGLSVRLPALRERSDLRALVRRLLDEDCGNAALQPTPAVLRWLESYTWPGNIRQLFNVLRSACVMAQGGSWIDTPHLPDDFLEEVQRLQAEAAGPGGTPLASSASPANPTPVPGVSTPVDTSNLRLEDLEVEVMRKTLESVGGNISEAAKRLGISRNTIYRKLRWKEPH